MTLYSETLVNSTINTNAYSLIDSLSNNFEFSDKDKDDLNYFFQENYGYDNSLINLLSIIHQKITNSFNGLNQMILELINGDYYHEHLLSIKIKSNVFEDSFKLDEISEELYLRYDKDDLDKLILLMEF